MGERAGPMPRTHHHTHSHAHPQSHVSGRHLPGRQPEVDIEHLIRSTGFVQSLGSAESLPRPIFQDNYVDAPLFSAFYIVGPRAGGPAEPVLELGGIVPGQRSTLPHKLMRRGPAWRSQAVCGPASVLWQSHAPNKAYDTIILDLYHTGTHRGYSLSRAAALEHLCAGVRATDELFAFMTTDQNLQHKQLVLLSVDLPVLSSRQQSSLWQRWRTPLSAPLDEIRPEEPATSLEGTPDGEAGRVASPASPLTGGASKDLGGAGSERETVSDMDSIPTESATSPVEPAVPCRESLRGSLSQPSSGGGLGPGRVGEPTGTALHRSSESGGLGERLASPETVEFQAVCYIFFTWHPIHPFLADVLRTFATYERYLAWVALEKEEEAGGRPAGEPNPLVLQDTLSSALRRLHSIRIPAPALTAKTSTQGTSREAMDTPLAPASAGPHDPLSLGPSPISPPRSQPQTVKSNMVSSPGPALGVGGTPKALGDDGPCRVIQFALHGLAPRADLVQLALPATSRLDWSVVQLAALPLFCALDLRTLLALLSSLLLGNSLLVRSSSRSLASLLPLVFLVLLRPFEWAGIFIPLIPRNLAAVAASPYPTLAGCTFTPRSLVSQRHSVSSHPRFIRSPGHFNPNRRSPARASPAAAPAPPKGRWLSKLFPFKWSRAQQHTSARYTPDSRSGIGSDILTTHASSVPRPALVSPTPPTTSKSSGTVGHSASLVSEPAVPVRSSSHSPAAVPPTTSQPADPDKTDKTGASDTTNDIHTDADLGMDRFQSVGRRFGVRGRPEGAGTGSGAPAGTGGVSRSLRVSSPAGVSIPGFGDSRGLWRASVREWVVPAPQAPERRCRIPSVTAGCWHGPQTARRHAAVLLWRCSRRLQVCCGGFGCQDQARPPACADL